jgi:hypothetical protein
VRNELNEKHIDRLLFKREIIINVVVSLSMICHHQRHTQILSIAVVVVNVIQNSTLYHGNRSLAVRRIERGGESMEEDETTEATEVSRKRRMIGTKKWTESVLFSKTLSLTEKKSNRRVCSPCPKKQFIERTGFRERKVKDSQD